MKKFFVFVFLILFSGCSETKRSAPGVVPNANAVRTELYSGGRMVDSQWTTFLNDVVTPRFSGFTVIDGVGFWEGRQMPSKVLIIVHGLTPIEVGKIEYIRSEFKRQFRHESVLRVSVGAVYEF